MGGEVAKSVEKLLTQEGEFSAPDLLVFEILAVLRRAVSRGELREARADAALSDLGDLSVELFPCLPLRRRAWSLRENLTAADALFVALAEMLDEPLAPRTPVSRTPRRTTRARTSSCSRARR